MTESVPNLSGFDCGDEQVWRSDGWAAQGEIVTIT